MRGLGLGAPRTTGVQEGLATFTELITGAIDIDRLERIALRVIAIDMALAGADFVEDFRFLIEAGPTGNRKLQLNDADLSRRTAHWRIRIYQARFLDFR